MSECLAGIAAKAGTQIFNRGRYLLQNMDWLEEELGGYDDDYLVFDCPGPHRLQVTIRSC